MEESSARLELADRLRAAIAAAPGGILPFEEFMRRALYEPALGYYERTAQPVGRAGDFYTSVSVGSVFGELLAHQMADWLALLPAPPCLLETGAHDARLAADVLTWFQQFRPAQFESLTYWIIEPSPARQAWQRERLAPFSQHVRWSPMVPSVAGIHFSNELLDAFPVRAIRWDAPGRTWREIGVTWAADQFRETTFPCRPETPLPDVPTELLDVLPDGFTTETSPLAESWWSHAAAALPAGFLVAIDYGLPGDEFIVPQRQHGTRRGYRRHRTVDNLLEHPGECDLTAHVNFTRIQRAGERSGARTEFLAEQRLWLTEILRRTMSPEAGFAPWTPARIRQFQTLTHPEHLGRSFRCLAQSKGIPPLTPD